MKKRETCQICLQETADHYLDLQGMILHRCRQCGLVFNARPLNQDTLNEIYGEKYFQKGYFNNCHKAYAFRGQIKNYKKYLRIINGFCPAKGRLLDVGCGKGVFLDVAAKDGWKVSGQDISPIAARHAKEQFSFPVFSGHLKSAPFLAESFDVVTMWDVIEHSDKPQEMLNDVLHFLKKDGLLFIWTLNQDCLMTWIAYQFYKININFAVREIYIPEHRFYFNQKTLAAILEKAKLKILYKNFDEYPLDRYGGKVFIKIGLSVIFLFHKIFNIKSEQVWVCKK